MIDLRLIKVLKIFLILIIFKYYITLIVYQFSKFKDLLIFLLSFPSRINIIAVIIIFNLLWLLKLWLLILFCVLKLIYIIFKFHKIIIISHRVYHLLSGYGKSTTWVCCWYMFIKWFSRIFKLIKIDAIISIKRQILILWVLNLLNIW